MIVDDLAAFTEPGEPVAAIEALLEIAGGPPPAWTRMPEKSQQRVSATQK